MAEEKKKVKFNRMTTKKHDNYWKIKEIKKLIKVHGIKWLLTKINKQRNYEKYVYNNAIYTEMKILNK